ncbi:MAG: addiction module protein [Desulfuromonas sp.]|nr:addiction module protein [Desulfuromonas sp.]
MNQILEEAIQLPEDQRLTLVNKLLMLGEPHVSDDVKCAWDDEIRERITRYDQGETCSRPAREVFSDLDRRLKL